jgi:succinate-semialdehyde dehydrogenase / glutarate-semialdehyde dehydrogenase
MVNPSTPGPSTLPTRNPRTGEVDFQMPVFAADEVAQTAAALRAAQPAWAALPVAQRVATLEKLALAVSAHTASLVTALAADTGRQFESALEVQGLLGIIRRWVEEAPALLTPTAPRASRTPHVQIEQHQRPYAVAGIISPWNFPLLLSMIDAIPALAAGCAVLIKPSEATPRFVPALQAAIREVPGLPEVLQLVTGAAATGEALIQNCNVLCFTGSVRTGQRVAQLAAQAFVPAHLELGGKDAALVCADADLPHAARALAWGSMGSAGQSCMSIERCYVDRRVHDEFVALLVAEVSALQHAWPDITQGQIGPIIASVQAPIVRQHLADAIAKGAIALTGGEVVNLGGGQWCQPTVLVNASHAMAVVNEETFAAILPVMAFDDEAEAVRLANATDFGLSACVFSKNLDRARHIAGQLQAGAISINDAALTAMVYDAAKQSFKLSGLGGSRMGQASLQRFYRQQAFLISDGTPRPWWFAPGAGK